MFQTHLSLSKTMSPSQKSGQIQCLNPSKSLSIYFRIFINYAQMVSIIHNLQLKWPYYVSNYLKITGNFASVSTQLLSLECLITDYNLDISAIYLKALTTVLIYFGFLLVSSSFMIIRKFLFRGKDVKNQLILLIIVISVMIQPNSIKEISDIFNCTSVEDKSYLDSEMSVECYTTTHKKWVF